MTPLAAAAAGVVPPDPRHSEYWQCGKPNRHRSGVVDSRYYVCSKQYRRTMRLGFDFDGHLFDLDHDGPIVGGHPPSISMEWRIKSVVANEHPWRCCCCCYCFRPCNFADHHHHHNHRRRPFRLGWKWSATSTCRCPIPYCYYCHSPLLLPNRLPTTTMVRRHRHPAVHRTKKPVVLIMHGVTLYYYYCPSPLPRWFVVLTMAEGTANGVAMRTAVERGGVHGRLVEF
mmetsp:Transcript_1510/g.3204  ORF Transcript_1510/g.3204 Transcript_1510/m.3204 type:complete len:228 (+) Transcript_1510:1461-2144(+)